jgi:hypothetical protein
MIRATPALTTMLAAVALAGAARGAAFAQANGNEPLAKGVQDNSFLIEEAYNQEPGVVHHIGTLRRQGRDWFFAFTQEWPVRSQTHQLSYTVPYQWLWNDGERTRGVGDLFLNYRLQALMETDSLPAFAPRVSFIVPSGDRAKGTGSNSTGYQVNLPFSKIVADRLTLHLNAGTTLFFDVEGRRPTSYNLGGSAVLAVTRNTNLLVEVLHEWNESVAEGGILQREKVLTVLPGVRHAFNFQDAQLVLGLGAPIYFLEDKREYGVFLYLSYEHKFSR